MGGEFVLFDAEKSKYRVSYLVNAPSLRRGENIIEASLNDGPTGPVELHGITLKVEYKADE